MDTLIHATQDALSLLPTSLLNLALQLTLLATIGFLAGRWIMRFDAKIASRVYRWTLALLVMSLAVQIFGSSLGIRMNLAVLPRTIFAPNELPSPVQLPNLSTPVSGRESTFERVLKNSTEQSSQASRLDAPTHASRFRANRPVSNRASQEPGAPDTVSWQQFVLWTAKWQHPHAIAWLLISLLVSVGLVRFLTAAVGVRRIRRSAMGVGPRAAGLFAEICKSIPTKARLSLSDQISSPCSMGLLRKCILLPTKWQFRTNEEIKIALMHEVLHVQRHDPTWFVFAELMRSLLWFHPVIRWLVHDHRLASELACDQAVIQAGIPRLTYAESLIRAAEQLRPKNNDLVVTMATHWKLSRRVERILLEDGNDATNSLRMSKFAGFFSVLMACVAGLGGFFQLSQMTAAHGAQDAQGAATIEADDRIVVKGRVLKPDGTPAIGANVRVLSTRTGTTPAMRPKLPAIREVDVDSSGRYQIEFKASEVFSIYGAADRAQSFGIVASHPDFGPSWLQRHQIEDLDNVELQLVSAESLLGRITDPDGRPLEGVRVVVAHAYRSLFDSVPESVLSLHQQELHTLNNRTLFEAYPYGIPGFSLDHAGEATTDANGKFVLPDVGHNRLLSLAIEREGYVRHFRYALTANIENIEWTVNEAVFPDWTKREVLFGNQFELALEKATNITGVVVDDETNEPIQNCLVGNLHCAGDELLVPNLVTTTTDNQGRFSLRELRGGPGRSIAAQPDVDTGYVMSAVDLDEDQSDVTIRLKRGTRLRGTIRESKTERPANGYFYYIANDSKQFTQPEAQLHALQVHIQQPGSGIFPESHDGSFELVVPQGGGYLAFIPGPGREYLPIGERDLAAQLQHQAMSLGIPVSIPSAAAICAYDDSISPDSPIEMTVENGETWEIEIVDDNGQPVAGANYSRNSLPPDSPTMGRLAGSTLELDGLSPESKFELFVVNYRRSLGRCLTIDVEGGSLPDEVQLEPLGKLSFQIIDESGQPYPSVRVFGTGIDLDQDSVSDENGNVTARCVVGAEVAIYAIIDGRSRLLFSSSKITADQFGDLGKICPLEESR